MRVKTSGLPDDPRREAVGGHRFEASAQGFYPRISLACRAAPWRPPSSANGTRVSERQRPRPGRPCDRLFVPPMTSTTDVLVRADGGSWQRPTSEGYVD